MAALSSHNSIARKSISFIISGGCTVRKQNIRSLFQNFNGVFAPSIFLVCTLNFPSLHPQYYQIAPSISPDCTLNFPSLHPQFPQFSPSISPVCTLNIPCLQPQRLLGRSFLSLKRSHVILIVISRLSLTEH